MLKEHGYEVCAVIPDERCCLRLEFGGKEVMFFEQVEGRLLFNL